MDYKTLISSSELAAHLENPDWVILDCRFSLQEPQSARQEYLRAHLPSASFADLDHDLSAQHIPGVNGRHPLPTVESLTRTFSNWGIDSQVQVICYDATGGAIAAARAWWLLRWLGHPNVAVLDGGWQRWLDEGRPTHSGMENKPPRIFTPRPRPECFLDAAQVSLFRQQSAWRLLDARGFDRFCGLNETIDPKAGHIPGAISAPYATNLTAEGTFLPAEVLRQRYLDLLDGIPAEQSVIYCGSGVSAAHNILAVLHAGLGEARLYAGSWSDWITDPNRPIAVGPG